MRLVWQRQRTDHTLGSCLKEAGRFLMFVQIASAILLTFTTSSTQSASISYITHRSRHYRSRSRSIRDAQDSPGAVRESLGRRNCSEQEKQRQGCLAGTCAALVTSQLHTFIICRCPSDRQGPRCEEVAINTDSIAEILKKQTQEELCRQERYDILSKSLGYESLFVDCVKRNYNIHEIPGIANSAEKPPKDKKVSRKREILKRKRERARLRKLRKRQRKREKKKGQRSSERASQSSSNIDTRDSLQASNTDHLTQLLLSEKDFRKRNKDHSGHNHKVRHEAEKSLSRRRRKSLTTFLVGTPTMPLTTLASPTRKERKIPG